MTIAIRRARLADALGMALVHRAAVHGALPGIYDRAVRDNWAPPVSLERAERLYREGEADGGDTIVAEVVGEIVGFCLVYARAGDLSACYVAPQHARRGIGRALYRAAEDLVAAARRSELTVRSSRNAEPFYRSLGFTAIDRTAFRFADGTVMPVVMMRKRLAMAA
jgi:putative acetyltransferase